MPRKPTHYLFTVKGNGRFPVDMLRYDRAYPRSTPDAIGITSLAAREVTLISVSEPTAGRWQSFGWTVTDSKPLTIA